MGEQLSAFLYTTLVHARVLEGGCSVEWSVQECRFQLPSYHIALLSIMWMSEALEGRPRVEDVRAVWELEHFLSVEAPGV